jgi:hypothetical protein
VKTQPPIRGNLDPPLYYAHLRFGADKWAMPGYRIPLPRGRYEVTLPFCGVRPRACRQRFAIEVEGQLIRDGLEPLVDPGLGVPFEVRAEVEVTDGALEVLFTRIEDEAFANAIEVRRVN